MKNNDMTLNPNNPRPIPNNRAQRIVVDADDDFFGAVLNCAVRYALGRASYMPSLVMNKILPWLPMLTDKTLWCFERDIEGAPSLGHPQIDAPTWLDFLGYVKDEIASRKNDGKAKKTVAPDTVILPEISLRDMLQGYTVDLDADACEVIRLLTEDGRLLPMLISNEGLKAEAKRRGYYVRKRPAPGSFETCICGSRRRDIIHGLVGADRGMVKYRCSRCGMEADYAKSMAAAKDAWNKRVTEMEDIL